MNLNGKQIFLIVGAVISVLMVAGPQLTDLFGAGPAKYIASVAGLLNLIINSVMAVLTGTMPQGDQVRQVLAMTGVENIGVNAKASPELARLAVDQHVDKIAPIPAAVAQVTQIARAA